jgi:TonB family protein
MQPSDIENMTYVFGTGLDSRSIKFIDGKARWDTDTCGIDKKSIVYGNLQGNAERAAVLVMGCGGGGSGDFRSLVAVWNANGTLVNSAEKELGDRIVVNSIAISDGIVTVDMLTQGPTDGMCCPTQRKILRLALQGNQLVDVQVKNQLTTPTRIPKDIKKVTEKEARPTQGFGGANMEGMGRSDSGVMGSVFGSDNAPKVKTVPQHINISNDVAVGLLLQKTQPIYPPIAMAARVSGTVVLQVTISKTGTITNLHVVSGPAMLQQAAMDAVKTWRYRPYLLNNEPVEVETTINVFFSLGG